MSEFNVKTDSPRLVLTGTLVICSLLAAGCATPGAKDFSGSWKPVNRFQDHPTEIPLEQAYTFYAAPMDETLKAMLNRWATDTGRTLAYRLPFDVTLYKPVSSIHTADVQAATARLNTIYAAQGVSVIAYPREILVQPTSRPTAQTGIPGAHTEASTGGHR